MEEMSSNLVPPAEIQSVITLDMILNQNREGCVTPNEDGNGVKKIGLPRRIRLFVALTVAKSVLQLHSGPWLKKDWGKQDICFIHKHDGEVKFDHPLLLTNVKPHHFSTEETFKEDEHTHLQAVVLRQQDSRSSIISLDILILELWFYQSIESSPLRKGFLGPDGNENEFTNFNTVQKWQETALEEGGLDLHNATRRCIYCAFGAASQDLNDKDLQRGIYEEVVQALERLLERYTHI